jgi:hypothetical protein
MFYGLTTGTGNIGVSDYLAPIAPKILVGSGRVPFPRDGPITGTISRIDAFSFNLPTIGTYEVNFTVQPDQLGQLQLELNGTDLPETVASNLDSDATSGHPIVGNSFVTTTVANSILAVVNPTGNVALNIIDPVSPVTHANSQTITIKQIF